MIVDNLAEFRPALLPVFALICWTFVMWVWMFATRIPAMQKSQVDPQTLQGKTTVRDVLPTRVLNVSDNYNHLHEQPTLFYALAFYLALGGGADNLNVMLLWAYVILRVLHSLIQATVNIIMVRFLVFLISSLALMAILVRELIRLFAG